MLQEVKLRVLSFYAIKLCLNFTLVNDEYKPDT
jgi:hypothetical protein